MIISYQVHTLSITTNILLYLQHYTVIFLVLATWFSWNVWQLVALFMKTNDTNESMRKTFMWIVLSSICIVVYTRITSGRRDPDQYAARLNKYLEMYGARYEYPFQGKPSNGMCVFEWFYKYLFRTSLNDRERLCHFHSKYARHKHAFQNLPSTAVLVHDSTVI